MVQPHPNQIGRSGEQATTPIDLEYAGLKQALTVDCSRYDDANKNLQRVLSSFGAYQQGQSTTLLLQDKPLVLDTGTGRLRQIALSATLGLVIGGPLAAMGTILLTLADGTIRYGFHARQLLNKTNLLELPEYKVVKPKKTSSGQPEFVIPVGVCYHRRCYT